MFSSPFARSLRGALEPSPPLGPLEKIACLVKAARYDSSLDNVAGADRIEPIEFPGRAPTILALHGYCGSPAEVGLVSEVARDLGLGVRVPVLPGHGTRPSELRRYDFNAILSEVRPIFDEVRRKGPVILVGMSMGSLLATELCLSAPGDVAGLVYIANAFWLKKPFPGTVLRCTRDLGIPDFGMLKLTTDLGDAEARRTHVSYRIQPTALAASVEQAGDRLARELFRIHRPVLILHGAKDRVCPAKNARRASELLGTEDKRVVVFPASRHILCRDIEKSAVRAELEKYLRRIAGSR